MRRFLCKIGWHQWGDVFELLLRQRFWVGERFIVDPTEWAGEFKSCQYCGITSSKKIVPTTSMAISDIYEEPWYEPIKRRSLEHWC